MANSHTKARRDCAVAGVAGNYRGYNLAFGSAVRNRGWSHLRSDELLTIVGTARKGRRVAAVSVVDVGDNGIGKTGNIVFDGKFTQLSSWDSVHASYREAMAAALEQLSAEDPKTPTRIPVEMMNKMVEMGGVDAPPVDEPPQK